MNEEQEINLRINQIDQEVEILLNKEGKLFDKVRIGQNSESSDAESSSF